MRTLRQYRFGRALALGGLALTVAVAGCNNFLTGSKQRNDPSNPTGTTPTALFVAIQLNVTTRQTDFITQSVCIWLQQCAGQVPPYSSVGTYSIGDDDYYGPWSEYYGGGGLFDLKKLEALTTASGDSIYTGQAYVLEAFLMSEASDIWGDIPYTQASQNLKFPHPQLDAQQAVYDSLLNRLATAIVFLGATGPTNGGVGGTDPIYGGSPAKWVALANSLRARIFLHMAKKLGPAMYDSALAAAALGINDSTAASDFVTVNNNTAFQANLWEQVEVVYAGNVVAGKFFVNQLKGASDSRLSFYFSPADTLGNFFGADPGQIGGTFSQLNTSTRISQGFRQTIIGFAEIRLIQAEASFQRGNAAQALIFLNSERTAVGQPALGAATLAAIMNEKYTQLFQNIELWSDWRRTNIPALAPFPGGTIPRRLAYQLSERSANPNIPGPGADRNWNDP